MILFATGAPEQGPESAAWLRSLKANQSFQCGHHIGEIMQELAIGRNRVSQKYLKISYFQILLNMDYGTLLNYELMPFNNDNQWDSCTVYNVLRWTKLGCSHCYNYISISTFVFIIYDIKNIQSASRSPLATCIWSTDSQTQRFSVKFTLHLVYPQWVSKVNNCRVERRKSCQNRRKVLSAVQTQPKGWPFRARLN